LEPGESKMSRLDEVRELVEDSLDLITQRERLVQTAQEPESRLNSQRWVQRHWEDIARWVIEARAICSKVRDNDPPWLIEAEASLPAEFEEEVRASLACKQQARDASNPDIPLDHNQHSEVGIEVSENTDEAVRPHLSSPLTEDSLVYNWNREKLRFAQISVAVEAARRVLRQRSGFRPGELPRMAASIGEAVRRATELEQMVVCRTGVLPHPTLEPRALDDLRHIAALSERILDALDNLDVEASLGEPASALWIEQAEQSCRALDHYIASACDWMMLGQFSDNLDLTGTQLSSV